MKISQYHVGFVGFGHMAQVIFEALESAHLIPRSQILFIRRDAGKMKECAQKYKITSSTLPTLLS